VGETIGWPELARQVAKVYRQAQQPAVIFTENYGEAGAIDRYGPRLRLPAAYSGHNGFGYWGPPSARSGPVVAVGISRSELREFRACRLAARIENAAHIGNSEQGEPIYLCRGPAGTWTEVWPQLRHLG
jgi:hypothetical protein